MAAKALTDRYGRLHAEVDTYTKGHRIVTEMARRASPRLMKKLIEVAEDHQDMHVRIHATDMNFTAPLEKPSKNLT